MADNIDKSANLTSDIYGINEYVNKVKRDFTPNNNDDTLMLGIFGYLGQIFSDTIQNTIVMASEFSNESIPTKAKFEKNIIAHALGLGITDINAIPATMDIMLLILENDIKNWSAGSDWTSFKIDKDIPIFIGDYEFHIDYDIVLKKISLDNKKFAYTAMYDSKDMLVKNPISDITNPYLTPPIKMNVSGQDVILVKCTIRQVQKQEIYKKVLSDNSITAKTFTFNYEDQLAAFTIDVKEGDTITHLIPVYEGLDVEDRSFPYFWYTYLDSGTIRVKFDRTSYMPRINCDVTVNLQTTKGADGNFLYKPDAYPVISLESEKYGYSNISCEIRPINEGESSNGIDKKSVEELQKLIPKEALSRGSITNMADLENFFNMINTDSSMLYFYKKRDNALERLYYSFILMKDKFNTIIPTNTIDIKIKRNSNIETDGKQVVIRDQCFGLTDNNSIGIICPTPENINQKTVEADIDGEIKKLSVYTMYKDGVKTEIYMEDPFTFSDYGIFENYDSDGNMTLYVRKEDGYYEYDKNTGVISSEVKSGVIDCIISSNYYIKELIVTVSEEDKKDEYKYTKIDNNIVFENKDSLSIVYDDESMTVVFEKDDYGRYILCPICDDKANSDLVNGFYYVIPYNFVVNTAPLYGTYFLTTIDTTKYLDFSFINENSECQYIATYINWRRGYKEDPDTYKLNITLMQNITTSEDEVTLAKKVETVVVLYDENDNPVRWTPGRLINEPDSETKEWKFEFNFKTSDNVNLNNMIEITDGIYELKSNSDYADAYNFKANTKCMIHVFTYQEKDNKSNTNNKDINLFNGLESIIPGLNEKQLTSINPDTGEEEPIQDYYYILSNSYTVLEGLDFFYDYSSIINSTVTESIDGNGDSYFTIRDVPVVRYDYFDEDKAQFFCKELIKRKNYIEYAMKILEDAFEMNFKFFNTYGPSKLFSLDNENNYINSTNIGISFRLKLKPNYDTNITNDIITDIKAYIEDINKIESIHIPNLVTLITTKYSESIEFFEFLDMNGYGPSVQHLYAKDMPKKITIPEFININCIEGIPDINLILV